MVQINFATREVSCKVVYYGSGLCGKTTNLQQVHDKAPSKSRGTMTSIATEGDRTLFFDFMPLDLGTVAGMKTKMQLYTVPGQVYYNATRKIVLEGVDGIIFVADSSASRREANLESWQNLKDNLSEYGLDIADIPLVIQFNKRDLPDAMSVEQMNAELNDLAVGVFEATAVTGKGVMPTLRELSSLVLQKLNQQPRRGARRRAAPAPEPAGAPATASIAAAQAESQRSTMPAKPVREGSRRPPAPAPTPVGVARQASEPSPSASTKAEGAGIPSVPESPPRSTAGASTARPSSRRRLTMAGEPTRKRGGKLTLAILGILVILVVAVALALAVLGAR